jgi:carbamoyltransferase
MNDAYVIGIGYSTHDISVCLMRGGEVVTAIARERLSRYKHDGVVSGSATWDVSSCIDYCLEAAGIGLDDVACFVESDLLNQSFEDLHTNVVSKFKKPYSAERSILISHHLAHAYSAYYASGFDDAAVLVVDGGGNELQAVRVQRGEDGDYVRANEARYRNLHPGSSEKISAYSVRDGQFDVVRKDFSVGSLGGGYQLATIYIFDSRNEAGKTMGLAPFGRPGRESVDFLASTPDGEIVYPYLATAMDLPVPPVVKKWPEDVAQWDETRRRLADMAWKVQDDLEHALIRLATSVQKQTGQKRLCLAGGVALNSVANKLILDRAGFDEIYIVPPAGDDGISIGCAYYGTWRSLPKPPAKRSRLRSASVGRTYPDDAITAALSKDRRLRFEKLAEAPLLEKTIDEIAKGKIVGWFHGGSEIGPRALGHRSILADARHPDMKAILNRRVKFREAFRPFAPVVTLERSREFFDLDVPSPYMLLIAPVHEKQRALLPSITHVDGTARVQTVTEADDGRYYRLVKRFGDRTGVPVLVNTSFNIKGEPIVETPADAVECFLCNDMDVLILEDYFVEKVNLDDEVLLRCPVEPNPRIVVSTERRVGNEGWETTLATVAFCENREHKYEVSETFTEVLVDMDGQRTVAELAERLAARYEASLAETRTSLLASVRDALAKNFLRLV